MASDDEKRDLTIADYHCKCGFSGKARVIGDKIICSKCGAENALWPEEKTHDLEADLHICRRYLADRADWSKDRLETDTTFASTACEGWPHAIRRALTAEAEVEKLKAALFLGNARIAELDAQCAAMRQLLEYLDGVQRESEGVAGWHRNGDVAAWDEFTFLNKLGEVLSSDAGRSLLARLQALERVADAAKGVLEISPEFSDDERRLEKLAQALARLEEAQKP